LASTVVGRDSDDAPSSKCVNAGSHRGHVRLSSGLRRSVASLRFDTLGTDGSLLVGMARIRSQIDQQRIASHMPLKNCRQIKLQAAPAAVTPVGIAGNFVYRRSVRFNA